MEWILDCMPVAKIMQSIGGRGSAVVVDTVVHVWRPEFQERD